MKKKDKAGDSSGGRQYLFTENRKKLWHRVRSWISGSQQSPLASKDESIHIQKRLRNQVDEAQSEFIQPGICEACRISPIEEEVESEVQQQPYRVCYLCSERLLTRSLRPLEWFNLAAIHGPYKHHLHADFYSEGGIAEQPSKEVEDPEKYPAPSFDDVRNDLERLLDYLFTRQPPGRDEMDALGIFEGRDILTSLNQRVGSSNNIDIEACALDICAKVIPKESEGWVRQRWNTGNLSNLPALASASAICLPPEEGLRRVTDALAQLPESEVRNQCIILGWFHSPLALDWLETHVEKMEPYSDNWGRLAALSGLTWGRAVTWIHGSKRLALIAIDGLLACWKYDTVMLKEYSPKLLDPAPVEEMIEELDRYAQINPSPRVDRRVGLIKSYMNK